MKQIREEFLHYLGEVETSLPEHKYVPEYLNFKYFKLIEVYILLPAPNLPLYFLLWNDIFLKGVNLYGFYFIGVYDKYWCLIKVDQLYNFHR